MGYSAICWITSTIASLSLLLGWCRVGLMASRSKTRLGLVREVCMGFPYLTITYVCCGKLQLLSSKLQLFLSLHFLQRRLYFNILDNYLLRLILMRSVLVAMKPQLSLILSSIKHLIMLVICFLDQVLIQNFLNATSSSIPVLVVFSW